MSRNEEFNDIPDLGPARDDPDHSEIPTLKPPQPIKNPSSRVEVAAAPAVRSPKGLAFLVVFVILASAAFGYWSVNKLAWQSKQLALATQSIEELQSRLADFEALVSAADESASKSGAVLQAQFRERVRKAQTRVQHVDSEIRKLWTVYQKYQPKISALEKQQKTIAGSLDNVGLSLDQQSQSIGIATKQVATLDDKLVKVDDQLVNMDNHVAQLNKNFAMAEKQTKIEFIGLSEQLQNQDLANQEVDDIQSAQLTRLQNRLKALSFDPRLLKDLQAKVQDQQKSLNSIDAHRRQINSEVLRLKNRIGQLQSTAGANQ